jgi:DNA-binding beta-propeller fold protein YncE
MRFLTLACCVLAVMLAGCAETRYAMQYGKPDAVKVWPPAPDVPRYRYVGELTGEENFIAQDQGGAGHAVASFFKALVGLGDEHRRRKILYRPQAGMVGPAGRIFVTDAGRQAVFVFDETAGKLAIWEEAGKDVSFVSPVGIALAINGDVLVADSEQGRVFRLTKQGEPISSFGYGDLDRPTGLAVNPATGRIYVADTAEHNIKVYEDSGKLVAIVGKVGTKPGQFNAPTHLAFANGKLYVTDTFNARVQVFDADGNFQEEVGHRGLFIGNLVRPKGVAADTDGNIYIIESFHDYLLVYNPHGEFLLPIGGTGSEVGHFYLPAGVWTDKRDRVYVADMFNGRVVVFQYLSQNEHPDISGSAQKEANK